MTEGFKEKWFQELSSFTQAKYDMVQIPPNQRRPYLGDIMACKYVSKQFVRPIDQLIHSLYLTPFAIAPDFRFEPSHMYDYPKGRAYRQQWNIAFTALPETSDYWARVGIGFSINLMQNSEGGMDFTNFLNHIRTEPERFTALMSRHRNYTEPTQLGNSNDLVAAFENYNLRAEDWVFFGRQFNFSIPEDRVILEDVEKFVGASIGVFSDIRSSGFGY